MNRNLILLWLGDAISLLGTAIYTLAIIFLSESLTNTALGAGTVLFASSIPYLFLGVIGGVYADRLNRKAMMIGCDLARCVLVLLLPVMLQTGHPVMAFHVALIGFLVTCFRTFFFPANNASIPGLVTDPEKLDQVNGYFQLSRNLALVLGPALGGWLMLLHLNVVELLYIDSASYAVSAICIGMITFPNIQHTTRRGNVFVEAWHGTKHLIYEQRYLGVLLLLFGVQVLVGTGIMGVALPRIFLQRTNGESLFGVHSMVVALAAAGSAAIMTRLTVRRHELLIFSGYLLRGVCFVIMGLFPTLPVLFVTGGLIGVSYTVASVPLTTMLQVNTSSAAMGKVVAIRSTLGNLGDAFSYVAIGALASVLGETGGILAGAGAGLAITLLGVLAVRHQRAVAARTTQSA